MRSINFRLSGVFLFVFLVVVVLGLFSASRLSDYRTYSGQLRDRFFRSTQYLGDLNNYTSDFRAAEGEAILAGTPTETLENDADLRQLEALITLAQHSYEHTPHGAQEQRAYARFRAEWLAYRRGADQVLAEAAAGRRPEATALYMAGSRASYAAASDALGRLTELNLAEADMATQAADGAYEQARLTTIMAMVFAALVVVIGLAHMRRSIAAPLVSLARTMHRLANQETQVTIEGADRRDEIGSMARAVQVFRSNAVELAISQTALAQQAAVLAEKLAAEQKLTQLQRNFLSMASHEFRTPLTVIDGQAQRLASQRRSLPALEVRERAGRIRAAVQRTTGVIERLIDAARLADSEEGLIYHPAELDVAEVLHEVCRQYREVTPNAQILETLGVAPLRIVGDRRLLVDLFGNLISNAVKYSLDQVRLDVRAHAAGDRVVVEVEDQGVGIPEADQQRLFERYFRASNVSGIVGTGIGLYLVKMVVDLHGGEITVASEEGKGSRFTVSLPAAAGSEPAH